MLATCTQTSDDWKNSFGQLANKIEELFLLEDWYTADRGLLGLVLHLHFKTDVCHLAIFYI